jgi:hypothetical protein
VAENLAPKRQGDSTKKLNCGYFSHGPKKASRRQS